MHTEQIQFSFNPAAVYTYWMPDLHLKYAAVIWIKFVYLFIYLLLYLFIYLFMYASPFYWAMRCCFYFVVVVRGVSLTEVVQ